MESCGAEGDRTLDLVNAIHALSQLSYSPGFIKESRRSGRDNIDSSALRCKDASGSLRCLVTQVFCGKEDGCQ